MARVPLVLVKITVLPVTCSGVYSSGELPKLKSFDRSPLPLAAQYDFIVGDSSARAWASATSREGITSSAPASKAWTIVVADRRTSITTAVLPAKSAGSTNLRNA